MKITIDGLAWLPKADLSSEQIEWLKKTLTITQQISKEYASRSKPAIVQLYQEEETRLGIPREFFFEKMTKGHDIEYKVSSGLPWPKRKDPELVDGKLPAWAELRSDDEYDLTFVDKETNQSVVLREEQQKAMDAVLLAFKDRQTAGGLITAPTAWGKTLFALAVARRLRIRTAVLVHREFLMNQWRKRIERYIPDCKIGTIVGNKWDVDDCHIVLVMIETVASWAGKNKIRPEIHDMFGLIVNDEVHRASAPLWGKSLPVFNCKYRLGISAHPKRSDGLDKTIFYHIGQKIFTGTALMRTPKIRRVWTNYQIKHFRLNPGMLSMELAFKIMSKDETYNQDIINQILKALEADRKILVYSHTIEHLKTLKELTDKQWTGNKKITTDFYIGGMKEEQLDKSAESDIIFASYQMAKDSLDIPAIDTVVLAGPIRNPTQPAGRACREHPTKKDPIVVDIRADAVPVFRSYAESRDRVYANIYGDTYLDTQAKLAINK